MHVVKRTNRTKRFILAIGHYECIGAEVSLNFTQTISSSRQIHCRAKLPGALVTLAGQIEGAEKVCFSNCPAPPTGTGPLLVVVLKNAQASSKMSVDPF